MSRAHEVATLLAELNFPADDVRREIGLVAIEIAECIDAGDVGHPQEVHSPPWLLRYAMSDLTINVNDPPNRLHEIRHRVLSGWWEDRKDRQQGRSRS